ncbi:unnamed protein product, partial [Mesorhabditis belari]|uniref:Actin maturation protease n=1 Tax=Mesorhabditis belari TaxID=2138241 RepID=A0AAF3EVF1_9BILA
MWSEYSNLFHERIEVGRRECAYFKKAMMDGERFPGARLFLNKVEPIIQNGPQCGMGEIFSAQWLTQLVDEVMPELSTECRKFPTEQEIIDSLHNQSLFIIPYDCDKNHMPSMERNGEAAHWCLVIGYVYFDDELNEDVHQKESFSPEDLDQFYVLTLHGKSRQIGVWEYKNLHNSNAQLYEIGANRSREDYVIPPTGLDELRGKAVIVKKKAT